MTAPTTEMMAAQLVREGADPASAVMLAGMFLDKLQYDANGRATVLTAAGHPDLDDTGQPVTPAALLARFRTAMPQLFTSQTNTPSAPPAGESVTARAVREAQARRDRAEASKAAAEPNPWAAGSTNVTRQIVLAARDPSRAARLRAEAGVR